MLFRSKTPSPKIDEFEPFDGLSELETKTTDERDPTKLGWVYNDIDNEWKSLIVYDTGLPSQIWGADNDVVMPVGYPDGWNSGDLIAADGSTIDDNLVITGLNSDRSAGNWDRVIEKIKSAMSIEPSRAEEKDQEQVAVSRPETQLQEVYSSKTNEVESPHYAVGESPPYAVGESPPYAVGESPPYTVPHTDNGGMNESTDTSRNGTVNFQTDLQEVNIDTIKSESNPPIDDNTLLFKPSEKSTPSEEEEASKKIKTVKIT